ncbi:MAG: hypothetical protein N2203_00815 [Bacteroidia bacterium]|nr:hypothetical protein [Bacteroidia bacterium]
MTIVSHPLFKRVLFALSVMLHPVFLPVLLMVWIFFFSHQHYPMIYSFFISAELRYKWIVLYASLVTLMPIITLFLSKIFRLTHTLTLDNTFERRYFFTLIGIYYLLVFYMLKGIYFNELFRPSVLLVGVLSFSLLILSLFNFSEFKVSLHAAGYGILSGFFAGNSLVYDENYLKEIIFCVGLSTVVMIIRLLSNAHSFAELLAGWVIGWLSSIFVIWTAYHYF